jgi:hypothetical protein
MTATRIRCHVNAPSAAVYRALIDADAAAQASILRDPACGGFSG